MFEIQEEVRKFREARGWNNQLPASLAKSICIEAAELLEIFQWSEPTSDELRANPEKYVHMQQELADVLIYCLSLCSEFDLEPATIIREKLKHNATRYPSKS